jgi:hypothetical protein
MEGCFRGTEGGFFSRFRRIMQTMPQLLAACQAGREMRQYAAGPILTQIDRSSQV